MFDNVMFCPEQEIESMDTKTVELLPGDIVSFSYDGIIRYGVVTWDKWPDENPAKVVHFVEFDYEGQPKKTGYARSLLTFVENGPEVNRRIGE